MNSHRSGEGGLAQTSLSQRVSNLSTGDVILKCHGTEKWPGEEGISHTPLQHLYTSPGPSALGAQYINFFIW